MKHQKSSSIGYFFILLILSILILIPLVKPGFIISDDGDWMVIRLTAFYQSFSDGQFPVRFLSRLNHGYGYPVANFLYPGFLYIGSVLRMLDIPFITIVELILGGSVLISGVFIFIWLKKFFSGFASFIGASTLLTSPYFLYDLYKRGSVGELLATACVIVVLYCIESGFVWLLPPITALLFISHNTLAFLYGLFIMGYVIVRKKWDTIIPLLIGISMTLFFWIPAFFERIYVRFDGIQVSNPFDYFSVSHMLLFQSILFFVPLVFLFSKKKDTFQKEYLFVSMCLIVAGVCASVLGSIFWKLHFLEYFIQFPYRFLSILFIVGPWMIAYAIQRIPEKWKLGVGIFSVCIFALSSIPLLWNVESVVREEGYYTTNEGTTTVQDEYMPKWVQDKPQSHANEKLVLYSGKGVITMLRNTSKRVDAALVFEVDGFVEFNTVFYPGWGAVLDGKPVQILYNNPRGIMRVAVPKGDHTLSFEFRETAFRYLADVSTSIGVTAYGLYLLYLLTKGIRKKSRV